MMKQFQKSKWIFIYVCSSEQTAMSGLEKEAPRQAARGQAKKEEHGGQIRRAGH